jgi:hypothetical protein
MMGAVRQIRGDDSGLLCPHDSTASRARKRLSRLIHAQPGAGVESGIGGSGDEAIPEHDAAGRTGKGNIDATRIW